MGGWVKMKSCSGIILLSLLGLSSYVCGLNVSPDGDQILPVNSMVNVSLTCNASQDANNSAQTQAIWEVEGRQIQLGMSRVRTAFANIGIFIEGEEEEETVGVVVLIVSREARLQYQNSGLMVRCTAFTAGEPPITLSGNAITIRTYGRPDTPGNLQLVAFTPSRLQWERPANIPTQVVVNYTVIIESPTTNIGDIAKLSNQTQFSIERLEMELRESEMCHLFNFSVIAIVMDANDSFSATVMDTVPLSSDVSSIEETLKVVSVLLSDDDITVGISFKAIQSCSRTFPVQNYTLIVDGSNEGPTITATPADAIVTGTLSSVDIPGLVRDTMFQVGVQACSDVACRSSAVTIPLNTSDVQTAQVVFFENNIFLSCSFASGSLAQGCRFVFQVNLNETEDEPFSVLRSERGQQCNSSVNQRNGYGSITVLDVEADGALGLLSLAVKAVVIESENEYVEMTGCRVQRGVVTNRAISIAVPIVVTLFLLAVLSILTVAVILYYRLRKKAKPEFTETEYPDTLLLEIKSDNQKILKTSPSTKHSALKSLPVTSHRMNIRPTGSLPEFSGEHVPLSFLVPPERAAPIEVELGRDSVKVSLNKSALRAVARFHYMAKHHAEASEGSLTSEEALSLLPTTNFSRVHVTDEFKSLCCDLPPLEEGGEEEKEMQSWYVINTPPPSPEAKQQDNTSP